MTKKKKDPRELPALTPEQEQQMKELIREGSLDFEMQTVNPGWWSYDIPILVDHDEFIEAIARRKPPLNYDPNLTNCGRMVTQTVELTFQLWEKSKTMVTTVGGNCTGLDVIETAINNIEDELGGEDGEIILTNGEGDELQCELWDNNLKDMLVCARIIAIEPVVKS